VSRVVGRGRRYFLIFVRWEYGLDCGLDWCAVASRLKDNVQYVPCRKLAGIARPVTQLEDEKNVA
jgi:hypothetical protein